MRKAIKGFVKFCIIGVVFLIVLGIIVAAMSDGSEETTMQPTQEAQEVKAEPVQEAKPAAKPVKKEDPGISKEEFDQIKAGMSYEEVVKIVGGKGEVNSESGNPGEQFHTVMYTWEGESGFGANANAMFQGGKMESKAQFGLE